MAQSNGLKKFGPLNGNALSDDYFFGGNADKKPEYDQAKSSDFYFELEGINEKQTLQMVTRYNEKNSAKDKKAFLTMNNAISFKTVPKRMCLIENGHYTYMKDLETFELKSFDTWSTIERYLGEESNIFVIKSEGKLGVYNYKCKKKHFREKIEEFSKQKKMF